LLPRCCPPPPGWWLTAAAALPLTPTLRCRQAAASAAVAYVLFVVVVVVSITIAAAAFSWLLIVGSAPTIAVTAGVFVATVAVLGGSAAPAALLPPLTLQCRQTSATAAKPAAAGVLPVPPPPRSSPLPLPSCPQWPSCRCRHCRRPRCHRCVRTAVKLGYHKVTLSRKSHLFEFQDPEKVRTIDGMSSTSWVQIQAVASKSGAWLNTIFLHTWYWFLCSPNCGGTLFLSFDMLA
jgi:hypothetical protein